jgi:hypothetical protein
MAEFPIPSTSPIINNHFAQGVVLVDPATGQPYAINAVPAPAPPPAPPPPPTP